MKKKTMKWIKELPFS